MPQEYRTVAGEGVHETEVTRSRFRCALAPTATEEEARAFVARVREQHPTASHHCFAYVIGAGADVQRASDDGEPGGTAGAPMLQMLLRREVRYTTAVVSRWFGGTKLGAGGLIRAYGGAVGSALDALGTVVRQPFRLVTVVVDHQRAGRLERDLRAFGWQVRGVRYGSEVRIEVGLPDTEVEPFGSWLAGATAGGATVEPGPEVSPDG